MMRSLFAGISGLRNHQTRMDVIGNNIANVNTVGFKASRVNFQDMLNQTIQGASSGQGNLGGTNPMQVGLGMGLASIDTLFTDGSTQPTGKQTDLAISGSGFFVLSDGMNQIYTRSGAFDFDNQGNFLVPGSGYKVMGWKGTEGNIDTNQPVTPIQIPVGSSMAAKPSTSITYANNLSGDAATGTTVPASITVYDSKGNTHKIAGVFTKTATANQWTFSSGTQTADTPPITITGGTYTINFNTDGSFDSATPATAFTFDPAGAATVSVTPNFTGLTQYGGESTAQAVDRDGYAAGTLEQTTIDGTGTIIGKFSNGQTQKLAQVCLSTFNNPAGLTKVGDNMYIKSNNSGEPQVGPSGSGGRGGFNPGSLEMSNVDLAQEFSNMIITQRGFQANSKIITVTDEMLQDLANLKR
ncbi:flagellar hook protein FlgE [Dendrosporobacter sp. 1207_IL3150]|uniref:flagellar hook protein FlgE n=1 Tax=Dendrosporobacter sp. 1207_IL3150 TaxID=3084054 RepID=UPI002FDA4841